MNPHWRQQVREALEKKGLSMRKASLDAGRNETFVRDILQNNQTPSVQNFSTLAEILDLDPDIVRAPRATASDTTVQNSGLIDLDLFKQIIVKIDEKRRIEKIRLVSEDPNEFAEFVADLYNIAIQRGGSFDSIAHHFGQKAATDGD